MYTAFEISERILKRIACVATAEATLQDLAGFLRTAFGIDSIDYQWTNEDYESMDGMSAGPALLPITSTSPPDSTPGASPMARRRDDPGDRSAAGEPMGRVRCHRVKPLAGAKSFISENIGTGAELVGGYLKGERRSLNELPVGEAAIVKLNGERTAVFRDEDGVLHRSSAVCTSHGMRAGLELGGPDLGLLMPRSRFTWTLTAPRRPAWNGYRPLTISSGGTSVDAHPKLRQGEVFPRQVRREVAEADATTRRLLKTRHKAKGDRHAPGDGLTWDGSPSAALFMPITALGSYCIGRSTV